MADIVLRFDGKYDDPTCLHESVERINVGHRGECWIYGKKGTYCLVRNGEDSIASIGYVCFIDGNSIQETLTQILHSFQESQVGDLKKKLIGQYVLLIKKDQKIYLFSDFMGARNIFYSDNGIVISSSFMQVEDLLQTSSSDLDMYKVLEFLAVRHVIYPAWLGRSTEHKSIKWVLPYEYLAIDVANSDFRVGLVFYSIDNTKQSDLSMLSNELISTLRTIIGLQEFRDSFVTASLTGGRDSRLVATIMSEYYANVRFRTSVSAGNYDTLRDMKVARKIARILGVSLGVYSFQQDRDEEKFYEITEGFSPLFNQIITPLIDSADIYALGFGGIFGTELFMPLPWHSIDEYIQGGVERAKKYLQVEDDFWGYFREAIFDEFRRIKSHYQLTNKDDRDYIRLFSQLITARYGSFIISAFNRTGYQLEPYGCYAVLELALRVSPALWGGHRKLGGDALVQKAAIAKLNYQVARVLTYKHSRAMLPLSITSFPLNLIGFVLQVGDWVKKRFDKSLKESIRTDLAGGYYLSNGWETQFLRRTAEKYGMCFKSIVK